jgi:uncharacterized protein (DUF934 family)
MPKLIRDRAVVDDLWTLLRNAHALADLPADDPVIVPLALWHAERKALIARRNVGVWLAPDAEPADLAGDVEALPVIAVDFPKFVDGRGYSIARLLRDRYGYRGELRAVGDVLRDQLYAMAECGFDAFSVREDRDPYDALRGLDDFTGLYASTSRTPQPWFRRRDAARPAGNAAHPDL